jgi:hypothetical protein
MSAKAKALPMQHVSFICDKCGKKVGCNLSHYDVMACVCGKEYWALRPLSAGPLVAFPWPGTFLKEAA